MINLILPRLTKQFLIECYEKQLEDLFEESLLANEEERDYFDAWQDGEVSLDSYRWTAEMVNDIERDIYYTDLMLEQAKALEDDDV